MRINDRDTVNHTEAVRVTALSVRIAMRAARGKDTARLEARQERILADADRREAENDTLQELRRTASADARFEARARRVLEQAERKQQRRRA